VIETRFGAKHVLQAENEKKLGKGQTPAINGVCNDDDCSTLLYTFSFRRLEIGSEGGQCSMERVLRKLENGDYLRARGENPDFAELSMRSLPAYSTERF
jgi:hypothetical protein